jgi:hypothetical protein
MTELIEELYDKSPTGSLVLRADKPIFKESLKKSRKTFDEKWSEGFPRLIGALQLGRPSREPLAAGKLFLDTTTGSMSNTNKH